MSPPDPPLILTVPGIENSGPNHWQTRWERTLPHCHRVELGHWDRPHRNSWINQLNLAIRGAGRPVVLAAHSLGCLAVAWWARLEHPAPGLVSGALLVAPPEVDFFPRDPRLDAFAPAPVAPLPFPSILVASQDDPYISPLSAQRLARVWRSRFVDLGSCGHINADSGLGDWEEGIELLGQLPWRTSAAAGSGEASRFAHGREASSGEVAGERP
jgi:predicted alpha/beta hydrolase family esterase